jgi:transposase
MRFSFESRCRIVQLILAGASPHAAAAACGASRATGYRLWRRYREGGWAGLADRPSTPIRQPRRLAPEVEQEILAWREHLRAGPAVIAAVLERPPSTVGKVLRRAGRSRLCRSGREHGPRYERAYPGELLHVDTKKLGRFWTVGKRVHGDRSVRSRGARWQFLHIAIDDHSRLAYAELLAGEDQHACSAFLRRANAWCAERGITVERVLSDNAKAYHSHRWLTTCSQLGIERRYTRPYSPWTNGKAEALIKRCCANGPTASPTQAANTAAAPSTATSAGTTTDDHTARSAAGRRSAASHTSVVTTASPATSEPPRERQALSGEVDRVDRELAS